MASPLLHLVGDQVAYHMDQIEKWLVVCDECDGAGEWDEGPINTSSRGGSADPEYRQVICGKCDGTGKAEEEVEPITMEDLP